MVNGKKKGIISVGSMVYKKGSVVSMTSDRFNVMVVYNDVDEGKFRIAVGWAVVVTGRDSWVVQTRLEPILACPLCAAVEPFDTHTETVHGPSTEVVWTLGELTGG